MKAEAKKARALRPQPDHIAALAQAVTQIGPPLRHAHSVIPMLGPVICPPNFILIQMGKLALDHIC